MNKSEKEFDVIIQEALTKEEAQYFEQMGEQNLPQMLIGLYKGKNSWLNVVIMVMTFVVLGIGIYTFIQMLNATETNLKIEWMFYTILCFINISMLKIYSWNQLDKNALIREIKRLEYQVALLNKKK
ncbi:MAG TPA: DUF6768 family protein [Roseivirga sp.]